jgi:hypothetical protein
MTQDKLAVLRVVVPGSLLVFLVYTVVTPRMSWTEANSAGQAITKAVLLPLILGSLYRILNVRGKLLSRALNEVNTNIEKKIMSVCDPHTFSSELLDKLRRKKAFTNVFYLLVDKDPTLTVRAGLVRQNGLWLTSSIDLFIVGTLGWVTHLVLLIMTQDTAYLRWWYVWAGASASVVLLMLPMIKKNHLRLSNEQLHTITTHNAKEVRAKIDSEVAAVSSRH